MGIIKGVLKDENKDEALKRIARQVVLASKNSVYVIESLNSIVQNPDKYPNPELLIKEWKERLFKSDFETAKKEFRNELYKIKKDNLERLFQFFFDYFLSLIPFYFDGNIMDYQRNKKYKWTEDEFTELKMALFRERYIDILDNKVGDDLDGFIKIEKEQIRSLNIMNHSSRIKRKWWGKENSINWIYQTAESEIYHFIEKIRYKNKIYYKEDIFKKSNHFFLSGLGSCFDKFVSEFYHVTGVLHGFFKWN
ncbi:MAG: hypothetical protein LBE36_06775 [Flavobacteriaceae bacterium]|jgi:hypothetical protein|nr:hypothetical protein [Flavobacteriaceae bacterium]